MGVTGPQNKLSGILSEIQKELETAHRPFLLPAESCDIVVCSQRSVPYLS